MDFTEVGFGAAVIGNLGGETTAREAEGALSAAWAGGVRYVDTAPHYGLGLSERRIGSWLADRGPGRPRPLVSTKVGRLLEPVAGLPVGQDKQGFAVPAAYRRVRDYSADGVRRSLDASLARLGVDRVDIVLVHDPDDRSGAADPGDIVRIPRHPRARIWSRTGWWTVSRN
jgi:D-threo-aldose 1-dehydrogenase